MTQGTGQGERALFLSYAEEDGATAVEIAEWLGKQGFKVFLWQNRPKGGRFINEIEDELNAAHAFVALLSSRFLNSPWCHRETELAILREHDLQTDDPSSVFIHVLKISETRIVPGFLVFYRWIDMTAATSRDEALQELVGRLGPRVRSRQVYQARRKWVFVSYVREDSAAVDRIATELRARGVAVWLDRTELEVGDRWKDAITNAIREGEFFVACFSSAYSRKTSTYMNEELNIAIEELRRRPRNRRWFLPVTLDRSAIPAYPIGPAETLRDIHHLDFSHDWSDGVSRLVQVLTAEGS